jgi:hypothetical protein
MLAIAALNRSQLLQDFAKTRLQDRVRQFGSRAGSRTQSFSLNYVIFYTIYIERNKIISPYCVNTAPSNLVRFCCFCI